MKDIGKVKLTMQTTEEKFTKGVGVVGKICCPSLKLFAEVGKIEQRDYIGNLVKNWRNEISHRSSCMMIT